MLIYVVAVALHSKVNTTASADFNSHDSRSSEPGNPAQRRLKNVLVRSGAACIAVLDGGRHFHRTCSPRVAWPRNSGYDFRPSVACVGLDLRADASSVQCQTIHSGTRQLPSQPKSFRHRDGCHFLRHSDIAKGHTGIDGHDNRTNFGLAMGLPSQILLANNPHAYRTSPGDQLGMGAGVHREVVITYTRESPGKIPSIPWRCAMKLLFTLLSRIALLSVVAGAFAVMTSIYGASTQPPLPPPHMQVERRSLSSWPNLTDRYFPIALEGFVLVVIFALAGRTVLRLRLSSVSPNERQSTSLKLLTREVSTTSAR
jgi:hypothetical protein